MNDIQKYKFEAVISGHVLLIAMSPQISAVGTLLPALGIAKAGS
jgi:hypothetical protein